MSPSDPSAPRGPAGDDQRAGLRVELRRPVSLKFKEFPGFVNESLDNLSAGGMFIRTTSPAARGTVFDFELTLADGARLVHGLGEVVWVRERDGGFDRPAGMGVRFLSLEPESRALIDRILAEHAEPAAGSAAWAPPALDSDESWWGEPALPEPEPPAGGAAAEPPEPPAAPRLPGPSPYTYARSYRGAAVAQESRRPGPLLVILLVLVILVALAAAGFLLFPDVAERLLLGEGKRADSGAAGERMVVTAEPQDAGAEELEPATPAPEAEDGEPLPPAAAGETEEGAPEGGGAEDLGFFEPRAAPSPEPAAPPAPAPPPPAPDRAPEGPSEPAARAAAAFSRVLNVIWEERGEELVVTVLLDGPIREWDYSVARVGAPPPRALVRIQGVERPFPRSTIPVGTALVERIRLGFHPGQRRSELHVVVDLAAPDAELVRTEVEGTELRLHVGRGSRPAEP